MLNDLNEHELARLCDLRAAFRAGTWPAPVSETFASRHLIALHYDVARDDQATVTYECVLTRLSADGAETHFVTFLTMPRRSTTEPTVDLVVREYGRRFLARASSRRGQVADNRPAADRSAATTDRKPELTIGTLAEDAQFIAFLGDDAFTELIEDLIREQNAH